MLSHILLYAASFVGIWIGAGFAIGAVEKLSHKLRLSSFIVSFLVLGFFTSISEMSVGINSVLSDDPEIFIGNLIGASIVLFLFVIPLLAITGREIAINNQVRGYNLILPLSVVALPVLLSFDGVVSRFEAIVAVIAYVLSALTIDSRGGFVKKATIFDKFKKLSVGTEVGKVLLGILLIFISSHIVVDQTEYFSRVFGLSEFFISLMVIGIGTNLPELSLIVRSIFMKSNQVAFGDYLGSAAFNSFLYGILTLWYGRPIHLTNNYSISLLVLVAGLALFYWFAKSKHAISRSEAMVLFMLYILFVSSEIFLHFPSRVE